MSKTLTDSRGKQYYRNLLIMTLLIGSFCTVLNQTLLMTAYPDLMKEFSVSTSTVQWLTTGFLLVNGIMIPISAYLMNNIRTKYLYMSAIFIFLLGTIQCALAPNFNLLLVGRLIQAVGVGISLPLLQTIMLSIFSSENRGAAMGLSGLVVGLAPAIGPTLSGWIIDHYNWRYLFMMIIPIVVVVLILSTFFMADVLELSPSKIDKCSPVLSTIGFGSLLYGFSLIGEKGWLNRSVILFLVVGLISIGLFVYRQLHLAEPFLKIEVFKYSVFTKAAILSGVANMAMVGAEMVLPLYIQNIKGESALQSGLTLLPGALIMGIMMPITGKLFDRYGVRYLSIIGMILLTSATFPFYFLTPDTPNSLITVLYAIRMLGISMVMMPVTTEGMNALPDHLLSHGSAVNNTLKQIFSSIGTAILISTLALTTKQHTPSKTLELHNVSEYKKAILTATLDGYHAAFLLASFFSFIGIGLAISLGQSKKKKGLI